MSMKWIKGMALVLAVVMLLACAMGEGSEPEATASPVDEAVLETDEFMLIPDDLTEEELALEALSESPAPEEQDGFELVYEDDEIAEPEEALPVEEPLPAEEAEAEALEEEAPVEGFGSLCVGVRFTLNGIEYVPNTEAPEGDPRVDGVYLFQVTGPEGDVQMVTAEVVNGVCEPARLDDLPAGEYIVALLQGGFREGLYCAEAECILTVGPEHAPESPAVCAFTVNCTVVPDVMPAAISSAQPVIGVGQTYTLSPASLFPSGTPKSYIFASSNKKIVTVSAAGVVKGVKAGKATIGIKASNGKTVSFDVTVKAAPKKVKLNASKGTLYVGQQYKLSATLSPANCLPGVQYMTGNAAVVRVDEAGMLTAMAPGTATVTAYTYNKKTATCKVTVKAAPKSVALNYTEGDLCVKGTVTLKATVLPANAMADCTFASSNATVATVSAKGKVTALKAGKATISATTKNGLKAYCVVTVWKAPTGVAMSKTAASIGVGQQIALTAAVAPADANPSITWSTSSAKVATVQNGVVTGVKAGTANITAKASNGKKATCKVTVLAAPTSVAVTAGKYSLVMGETTPVKATLSKGSWSELKWTVEGDAVRLEGGNVVAQNTGLAIVYATASNGVYGYAVFEVAKTQQELPVESPAGSKLIIDISKYQGSIDFAALKPNVSLVIARASCGTEIDSKFKTYAKAMNSKGIPFGVYCYSKATTVEGARAEAKKLVSYAKSYNPRFYVIDAEEAGLTKATIVAFVEELRNQGVKKAGAYVAHNRYTQYGFKSIRSKFDFIWIPRYGKNDGTIAGSTKPSYACDLWQYTSRGSVPGISGRVDVSIITGQGKSLSWLCS